MAAMLSSYTLLSQAPAPAPGRKFSPASALQLRKQPVASVVAVPWASGKESGRSRRAPVFVCHAAKYDDKDIQPSEFPDDWSIMEDNKDQLIILMLNVGELTSKDQLIKVETTDDLASLVVKYTGDIYGEPLDIRLQVPHGYDGERVKAKMFNGWLVVAIAKHPWRNVKIEGAKFPDQP